MKGLPNTGVAACGLATSFATALFIALLKRLTGIDIFTFNVFVIVPLGALLTGVAAASGYYFGSRYFHSRPSLLLLVQMALIAGLTQLLIYYAQYATMIFDDGRRMSDLISFPAYLDDALTKVHLRGRWPQTDMGEAGKLGYVIAILQFFGLLAGGLVTLLILIVQPVCPGCQKYSRTLAKSDKLFPALDDLARYYDTLLGLPPGSPEFAALVGEQHKTKVSKGTSKLKIRLLGCPACKTQTITKEVHVFTGKDWEQDLDSSGGFPLPGGADLAPVFRAK